MIIFGNVTSNWETFSPIVHGSMPSYSFPKVASKQGTLFLLVFFFDVQCQTQWFFTNDIHDKGVGMRGEKKSDEITVYKKKRVYYQSKTDFPSIYY